MTDMNPTIALLGALLLVLVLWGLFVLRKNFLLRWKKLMSQRNRALIEDTLKHIYECERGKISCTLTSISGALSITSNKVVPIVEKLKESSQIEIKNSEFFLTDKGRENALRIVRLHRLWESYLASETGMLEINWHADADKKEHRLAPEEVELLNDKLGNPAFDPHGEPIPTHNGEIPSERGILLTELQKDEIGRIIQFEDEPVDIYKEIRDEGLSLGMQLRKVLRKKGRLHFTADGASKELSLIAAAQIRLEVVEKEEALNSPPETLLDLKQGERGKVIQIAKEVRGQRRRRLLDLGIVPGSTIENEMPSASGNPTAYRIKGALIALRKDQAGFIQIEKEGKDEKYSKSRMR